MTEGLSLLTTLGSWDVWYAAVLTRKGQGPERYCFWEMEFREEEVSYEKETVETSYHLASRVRASDAQRSELGG